MAEIRVNATGALKLYDNDDSHFVGLQAGSVSSNVTFTLPTADGSNGQVLTTNGSGTLSFATASSADPSSADGDSLGTASAEWSDLYLADGGIIYFGNDQDVTLTHDPDDGLFLKSIATGDDNPVLLTLQTGETDLAQDDVIGKIAFQAPDEGTGTDAILVSAAIQAVAEGDHSSSSNATSLQFMTGASEAAAEKMTLTSAGILNAGKIGVITDHDLGEGIHIRLGDSSASAQNDADALVIEDTHGSGMSILSGNDDEGKINFGDDGDNDIGGIIYAHAANNMSFRANAAVRAALATHSDGNGAKLTLSNGGNSGQITTAGGQMQIWTPGSEQLVFQFTNSETALIKFDTDGAINTWTTTDTDGHQFTGNYTSGANTLFHFKDGQGQTCGHIDMNAGDNTVAYNTSSDYRLKENVENLTNGITRLKQLKPYRFNWKSNSSGNKVDGFFAHEVKAVIDEAVTRDKDLVQKYTAKDDEVKEGTKKVGDNKLDENGDTIPYIQGIDLGKMVPLLTAALQESVTKIETLETEMTALKTRVKTLEDA